MLEKNIITSFSSEFSEHIENIVSYISEELNIEMWLDLVSFLPKHNHQEQREFLRRAMISLVTEKIQSAKIPTHPHSLPEALLNLNSLYKPGTSLKDFPLARFSLSHCKDYGLFACTPKLLNENSNIGVDLEISSRVTKKIISKVSNPLEVFETPSTAHLWTAKEASFKALTNNSTQLISDLYIHSWSKTPLDFMKKSVWTYQFKNTQNNTNYTGRGWVISFTDHSLAFSYLNSK